MVDMVQSALRRKLAAAQVVGDLDRIDVLRRMMTVPADGPTEAPAEAPVVPADVPADLAEVPEIVAPPIDEAIDPPDVTGDDRPDVADRDE